MAGRGSLDFSSAVHRGVVLVIAFLLFYVAPLSFRPLYLPDETRYAEIPREMLATGDWVVPRLDGLRYFEKPVLGYWVTALSISCFGESRFALRLPCALATALSAVLLILLLRRSDLGSSALSAAVIFPAIPQVYILGVFNTLDAVFSMFVTASIVCFYLALQSGSGRTRIIWLVGAGIACGLGFLTKGFLAFAIPCLTAVPFLLWQRRWKELLTLPWIPLLVALAVSFPWAMIIHLREPDYWRYFIFVEHLKRFMSPDTKSLHPEPFWFLLPFLIGGAIPWTFAVPAAIRGVCKAGWRHPLIRYAVCWLFFPFLILSFSRGKLGTYILPCFAPLSLLLAVGLTQSMKGSGTRSFRAAAWTSAAVAGLIAAVIIATGLFKMPSGPVFAQDETSKWAVGSAACLAWFGLSAASAFTKRTATSLSLFAIGPLIFMLSTHFVVPRTLTSSRTPEAFLLRYIGEIAPGDQIYSNDSLVPAVSWILKRSDIEILRGGGEFRYGLNYPDTIGRQVGIDALVEQIEDHNRTRKIILLVQSNVYSSTQSYLPEADQTDKADGFVMMKYAGRLEASRTP
ncbi:MAG: phospholipid carrier-dependent glycosyltransferase [Thermodesulfobacteriota bacterium]